MKTEICLGFGLGLAAGVLLMNNCKRVRQTVADTQDAVVEKVEAKKNEMKARNLDSEFASDNAIGSGAPKGANKKQQSIGKKSKKIPKPKSNEPQK